MRLCIRIEIHPVNKAPPGEFQPTVGLWEDLVSFHFSLTRHQLICSGTNTRPFAFLVTFWTQKVTKPKQRTEPFNTLIYFLIASTGSILLAWDAGISPDNTPTITLTKTPQNALLSDR